jgi:hypothetical protein
MEMEMKITCKCGNSNCNFKDNLIGDCGDRGERGDTGCTGVTGCLGHHGKKGFKGFTGPHGPTGITGITGYGGANHISIICGNLYEGVSVPNMKDLHKSGITSYDVLVQHNSMVFTFDMTTHKWVLKFPQPTLPYYFHNEFSDQIYYITSLGHKATKLFGVEGDMFWSHTNGNIYNYMSNKFILCCSVIGPKGETGQTGQTGARGYGQTGYIGHTGQSGITMGPTGFTGSQGSLTLFKKFDYCGKTAKKASKLGSGKEGQYGLVLKTGKLYKYCIAKDIECNDKKPSHDCPKKCHNKCTHEIKCTNKKSHEWTRVHYHSTILFYDKQNQKLYKAHNDTPTEYIKAPLTTIIETSTGDLYKYQNNKWIKIYSFGNYKKKSCTNLNRQNNSHRSLVMQNMMETFTMDTIFDDKCSVNYNF